ncbi:MAG: ABC transporter permease subunit, partial [Dethiobacteria bacterium]
MVHQALFKKELQQNRIKLLLSLLLLGAGAVALPLLFGRTWPVFSWTLDFSREAYDLYIWNRWTAGVMLYVSLFSALLFGAGAISGERAAGTEIVLLSKPLSRRE